MASLVDPRPLTERQLHILHWIDKQPHHRTWRDHRDALILEGPNGSLRIDLADNDRLQGMVEPNPNAEGYRQKHFVLSAAGRAALAREEGEDG